MIAPGLACLDRRPPLPAAGERWALFLDIDGTLMPIVETPGDVHPDARLNRLLAGLVPSLDGAVALISGRPLGDVARLFAPLTLPAAGQHGLERRDARGGIHRHQFDRQPLERMAHAARALMISHPGLELEDKGMSLALHFRRAPQLAGLVRETLARHLPDSGSGLVMQPGKMVMEVKPAGRDKGIAVREFMAEEPFRGRRPVFVGDDVTDEFGFRVVNELGGVTVKVGDGETAARWCLPEVDEVRDWLAALAARDEERI